MLGLGGRPLFERLGLETQQTNTDNTGAGLGRNGRRSSPYYPAYLIEASEDC
jgi:hypothetical protein